MKERQTEKPCCAEWVNDLLLSPQGRQESMLTGQWREDEEKVEDVANKTFVTLILTAHGR